MIVRNIACAYTKVSERGAYARWCPKNVLMLVPFAPVGPLAPPPFWCPCLKFQLRLCKMM